MKVINWNTETAKKELKTRLDAAREGRVCREGQWKQNERILFMTRATSDGMDTSVTDEGNMVFSSAGDGEVTDTSDLVVNLIMKDIRFIHSQMSANPPTIVPRPSSAGIDDRRAADAANRLIKFAMRAYRMQECQDRVNFNTLIYGIGYGKTVWDSSKGEIADLDGDNIIMEGDFSYTVPSVWDIYPDPSAKTWNDVRYVFEAVSMPLEEAVSMFPKKEKELKKTVKEQNQSTFKKSEDNSIITLYQYWEKGLPVNGMAGRFCWLLPDGCPLTKVETSPHAFYQARGRKKKSPIKIAGLPYKALTDIDIPDTFWGESTISFSLKSQEFLNELFNASLDTIRALGTPKLILPEGSEISSEITNSPWDVIKVAGNSGAWMLEGARVPPSTSEFIDRMSKAIMDSNGTNDAVFGESKRETSGFALQYATQQANMLRRRLFNKFVLYVEDVYKDLLTIIQDKWEIPRTIHVLGSEKAFEARELQGADILGGFDIVGEYGTSLSLDPMARKDEIMMQMPLLEKAGVPTRKILSMLKLSELEGMYDAMDLAEDRQREIIDTMTSTGVYTEPELLEDHDGMLVFLENYRMTADFKYLSEDNKELVEKHMLARMKMRNQKAQLTGIGATAATAMPGMGGAPAGLPGGLPPMPVPVP